MRSAQDYRKRAARAKRLAAGVADREFRERLEAIARGYEMVAKSIERFGEEPNSKVQMHSANDRDDNDPQ
jgi:hypothetical protein